MNIPIVSTLLSRSQGNPLGANAFFAAAHNVPADHGIEEISASYASKRAQGKGESVSRQKEHEKVIDHLEKIRPEVETNWQVIQTKLAGRIPHLVVPAIIAGIGVLAIVAEAKLLSPSMDVLHVTDPDWQMVTALGLVAIASLVFHFAWESFEGNPGGRLRNWLWRALAGGFAVALTCWGIFRGYQVAFSASISQNPLGDFLGGHPILASIFYVFVTLGTPVAAASATHYSTARIEEAYEYKTAKSRVTKLWRNLSNAKKNLEAEKEKSARALEDLDSQSKRDQATYKQYHERGRQFGAVQQPYWTVLLKSALSTLYASVGFCWLLFLVPIYAALLGIVWITSFLFFRRQWQSPTAEEFFEHERVQHAVVAHDADKAETSPVSFPLDRLIRDRFSKKGLTQ